MRIGLVTPAWPGTRTANGITTAVGYLAQGLSEIGHEVTIIARAIDAPHQTPRVFEVPRRAWTVWEKLRSRLGEADIDQLVVAKTITAVVAQAVAEHDLDTVIMEETHGWAYHVQKALRIPVVITLHGPWLIHRAARMQTTISPADRKREAREARALQNCAAITAPSRDVLETIQQAVSLPDIPQEVIPNPMPIPAPNPAFDITPPEGSLLFVGRFDRLKGGDVVLAGFANLHKSHPQARLTFVGPDRGVLQSDGSKLHIEQMLAELGPETRAAITYLGQRPADEVAALQCRHQIVLIASHYEVLGYTLLEAMSVKAAIICTAVGGPKDILEHEETALLIPPGDADALAGACRRLLDDPVLARNLGYNAQTYLRRNFASKKIASQTETLLRQLVT